MKKVLMVLALLGTMLSAPAFAGNNDPLFVNLTSDDEHRATMALGFSKAQLDRGHPVTIWLNDKGVFLVSKSHAEKYASEQKAIQELLAKGATVITCPMCMKHFGISEADLLEGAKVGNPDMTGAALFADGAKALSW